MQRVPDADGDGPRDADARDVAVMVERVDGNSHGQIERLGENPFVDDAIHQAKAQQPGDSHPVPASKLPQQHHRETITYSRKEQEDDRVKEDPRRQIVREQLRQTRSDQQQGKDRFKMRAHQLPYSILFCTRRKNYGEQTR